MISVGYQTKHNRAVINSLKLSKSKLSKKVYERKTIDVQEIFFKKIALLFRKVRYFNTHAGGWSL